MSRMLLPLLILALLLSALALPRTQAMAQSVFIVWEQRYNGGYNDTALAVAVDSNDNVIVTGYSERHVHHVVAEAVGTGDNNTTVFTLAHHPIIVGSETVYLNGTAVAPENYTIADKKDIIFHTAPEAGVAITADYDYEAANDDYYTIKYDPGGSELWNRTYDSGGSDEAHGIAVDSADNIIVTGYSEIGHVYHVVAEDVGTGNGTETNFTLAHHLIIVGSETIYLNETPQEQEKHQANETVGTGNGTETNFTLEYHPIIVGSETIYLNGTPQAQEKHQTGEDVGIGDNSTTVFTLEHHPIIVGSETIYLNDTAVAPENYTIDYQNGNITFDTAPGEGAAITADYDYIVYTIDYDNGTITFSVAPEAGVAITADYDYEAVNDDYYTIKYDPQGNELWNRTYDSREVDQAFAVAVDSGGNITVTGRSNDDYHTIKYDPNGTELWNRTYNGGGFDQATGVAVDSEDNIIVTGYSENASGTGTNDYYTIKYAPNGTELWSATYDSGGSDCAQAVAADSQGNIVVTGGSSRNTTSDFCTIKYDKDGNETWPQPIFYNIVPGRETNDTAFGVAVDSQDNIVVIGSYLDTQGEWNSYCTVKYSPDGDEIWNRIYYRLYQECAYSVAVDSEDNIILTGKVFNGKIWNYLSIKYAEQLEMARGGSGGAIAVTVIMGCAAIGGVVYYLLRGRIGGVVYHFVRGRKGR